MDKKYFVFSGGRFFSSFFFAPINTGFFESNEPSDRLINFHAERSSSYIGINYVGNVATSCQYKSNNNTLSLSEGGLRWSALADSIRCRGSLPGIQLACRFFSEMARRAWVADADLIVRKYRNFLVGLDVNQIDSIMNGFVRSASIAVDAGFEVIQIHAAHGYFLSLLLSPQINFRQDKYCIKNVGGIVDLLGKVRKIDRNILLDIRVSCVHGIVDSPDEEWGLNKVIFSDLVNSNFIDILSFSAGMYDLSKKLIYPNKRAGILPHLNCALEFAQTFPNLLVNTAGNLRDISHGLPSQKNLTYSIGRPLIADPHFVEKSLTNRESEIRKCDYSGRCHYFTRGESHISCAVNSDV